MRRITIAAMGAVVALGLAACSGSGAGSTDDSSGAAADPADLTVGVAMPTQTSERWIADGDAVEKGLKEAGYKVDLQFAGDDIPTQQQQIDQMITKGADLLIIASIDGTALATQLQAAADANIPVIAYDRLIRDSENVDFYVTFDNYKVGVQQATSLLTGLGILKADGSKGDAAGPFNVELFAGSLDDNNAHFFYQGAMDTLQEYIDNGTLVVKSGQTDIEQVATLRWLQETAQKRMEDLLTSTYSDGSKVDAILSPYDGISRGIISALTDAGYSVGDEWPIISGQDAEVDSVKAILSGEQYATIFKDTRELAKVAAKMAVAVLGGDDPEINDTETYDNGVKVVPSYLLQPVQVTKDNVKEALVDTGYWTADEIGL